MCLASAAHCVYPAKEIVPVRSKIENATARRCTSTSFSQWLKLSPNSFSLLLKLINSFSSRLKQDCVEMVGISTVVSAVG